MPTLLLRLAGPMQSWGTQSRFKVRDTGREPSKSGVIGLLCAALGKPREETPGQPWPPLRELARLKMGIRVDREGRVERDYHTAEEVIRADASSVQDTETSHRYYLADAEFLVGLEGTDGTLLERLWGALKSPVWPVFLGRKAFIPGRPVYLPDGLRSGSLDDTLARQPWLWRTPREREWPPDQLRLVVEVGPGTTNEIRRDQPVSFADRVFTLRYVEIRWIPFTPSMLKEDELCSSPVSS